jgi:integrase
MRAPSASLILAEWSEIDFEGKRWRIPKEHMKGHNSPHIVPLARQTIQVLELVRAISGKSTVKGVTRIPHTINVHLRAHSKTRRRRRGGLLPRRAALYWYAVHD